MLLITCDSASVGLRVELIVVAWSIGRHERYREGVSLSFFDGWGFICQFSGQRLISFPEVRSELWSVYVIRSLPGVVRVGVSCPPDSVLESSGPTEASGPYDLFHFPLRFAFDDVWGGVVVVWSVFFRFLVQGEKSGMEDVMDLPLLRNAQLVDHV